MNEEQMLELAEKIKNNTATEEEKEMFTKYLNDSLVELNNSLEEVVK